MEEATLATTQIWRYFYSDTLGPGDWRWKSYGPADALGSAALSVSAIPVDGIGEGGVYVLTVENINITDIEGPGSPGFPSHDHYVGFSVRNNGSTTITSWSISIGLITP